MCNSASISKISFDWHPTRNRHRKLFLPNCKCVWPAISERANDISVSSRPRKIYSQHIQRFPASLYGVLSLELTNQLQRLATTGKRMYFNVVCNSAFSFTQLELHQGVLSRRSFPAENGFGNPLENCLRGIKRVQGIVTHPRRPITAAILHRFYSLVDLKNYRDSWFWAACCTGFTTSTSSCDATTHLSLADVDRIIKVDRIINPTVLYLRIKSSKTDRFRQGQTLPIGATNSTICAVCAMMNYMHHRGDRPGLLFRHETGLPFN